MVFYLISGTCHFHSAHMHPVIRFNILRLWSVLFSACSFYLDFIFAFAPIPATAFVILCSVHSDFLISYYSVSFHTITLFFFERHFYSINSCLVLCVVLWLAGWLFGWLPTTVTLAQCLFNRTFDVSMIWVDDICLLLMGLCSLVFFVLIR